MKKNLSFSALSSAAMMAIVLGACATGEPTKETHKEQVSSTQEQSSNQAGEMSQKPSEEAAQPGQAMSEAKLSPAQLNQEMVLNQLHHMNQKEIQLSQMAIEKAQSPQVKNAAQEMLKDHQALETRVQELAKAQQLQLSDFQPATDEKQMMDRFGKLSGRQFDAAFMQNVHFSHKAAMENLKLARSEVRDPQIRSLIDQTIPKVSQHKQLSGVVQKNISSQSQAGEAGES